MAWRHDHDLTDNLCADLPEFTLAFIKRVIRSSWMSPIMLERIDDEILVTRQLKKPYVQCFHMRCNIALGSPGGVEFVMNPFKTSVGLCYQNCRDQGICYKGLCSILENYAKLDKDMSWDLSQL